MGLKSVTLVLAGAHAGKDIKFKAGLTEFVFVKGKLHLEGSDEDVDNLSRFLAMNYQAFPEGSEELRRVNRQLKGELDDSEVPQELASGVSEHQGGADDADGSDDQLGSGEPAAGDGGGDAGSQAGGSGLSAAGGNGPRTLAEVLRSLDPNDDEAWTTDGKPKMAAVEAILGRTDVTRQQVNDALPGFSRDQARSAA